MRVVVLGLGYVGTVTAAGLSSQGHEVVGVDVDRRKVDAINVAVSPVIEPGIDLMVEQGVSAGLLRATTDVHDAVSGADLTLICVGTPSTVRGRSNLAFIERALAELREAMETATPPDTGFHAVVIRSTVPPGTGATVVAPFFEGRMPPGWTVGTAMCPEFLREGSSVEDFFSPPFVVVGASDEQTARTCAELFAFLDQQPHHVEVATAESLKYACNAFHAVKVTFANEMGQILSQFGVDTREVMSIFCEDSKLNIAPMYLRPGFAFGGSCLPKDLRALQCMARSAGIDLPMINSTLVSNENTVRAMVDRVLDTGYRRVTILGLSFKTDTDDLRESPNLELAERFVGKGLDVRIYDPIVNPARLVGANLGYLNSKLAHVGRLLTNRADEALEGAEVVIISTTDPEALGALASMSPKVVIDLDGRVGKEIEHLIGYQGVCW